MRVTTQAMYTTFTSQINTNLSSYLDLNYQAATMKKVNAPSDDPVGAAHILDYRVSLATTNQLQSNVDTAKGWLELEDGVLGQVNTALIRIKELAEQTATGTLSAENREQVASELNQLMEELINLGNSEFAGRYVFAGQNIDAPPFEMGIGASSVDPNIADIHFEASGAIENSIIVRFDTGGTLPVAAGDPPLEYSYSDDGGATWQTGTVTDASTTIELGTASLEIPVISPPATITAYDPNQPFNENNGTSITVRPAAIYKGHDDSVPPQVTVYGDIDPTITPTPNGIFTESVQVRIDSPVDLTVVPQEVTYSYSTDKGQTWQTQTVESLDPIDGTPDTMLRLPVPGGFFDLEANFTPPETAGIPEGTQFTIEPQRANIDYESSIDSYIMVNSIGKDIFGGLYTPQGTDVQVSAFDTSGRNLFETVGRLIGALETNNQEGCARALVELDEANEQLLLSRANIGGRLNSLETTTMLLDVSKLDQTERLSQIEDVDVTELTMQLSMQQMAYQTVLQSSSMVMQLNLTNFM